MSLDEWKDYLPSIDVWITAETEEAYLLNELIAGDGSNQEEYGVRIVLEPQIKELYRAYREARINVIQAQNSNEAYQDVALFPMNLHEFLDKGNNIDKYFTLTYYTLNPDKKISDGKYVFQTIDEDSKLSTNPLKNLIVLNFIEASRQFGESTSNKGMKQEALSTQFQKYHSITNEDKSVAYNADDIPLYKELNEAHIAHNKKLESDLAELLHNLSQFNYPGFHSPSITIDSVINLAETIHSTSVQFSVDGSGDVRLHEDFNGLGYRNLLWICVQLYIFKYERLHKLNGRIIAPIHLIFIEEPEAHLHAQAQQVFIKKVYEMINKPEPGFEKYSSQMVISTHSNHIVNEIEMDKLRFFKRKCLDSLKIAEVVNLKNVFGDDDRTKKFVTRYIRLMHCDLYFADAVILVEGPAEKILMKHFLTHGVWSELNHRYISVIEINGSHAHKFRQLIERLDVFTLIITDIDSQEKIKGKKTKKKIPEIGKHYETNNDTLKKWIPRKSSIDELLNLKEEDKVENKIRIAYQTGIICQQKEGKSITIFPYTFEDALVMTNVKLFGDIKSGEKGIETIRRLAKKNDVIKLQSEIFKRLSKNFPKAEFAVNVLYSDNFNSLKCPDYITQGLEWLKNKLNDNEDGAEDIHDRNVTSNPSSDVINNLAPSIQQNINIISIVQEK